MPLSSRQIAEAHYKLSMVLDLTSGRLGDAIVHAQKALESVEARLVELKAGLDGTMKPVEEDKTDAKGKGKASGSRLVRDGLVQNMSEAQIAAEAKELGELKEDLALKVRLQNVCFCDGVHSFGVGGQVEELKTSPNEQHASAPELVARALDSELNASGVTASISKQLPVNDLTMAVKKKKKAPDTDGQEKQKRKADDEGSSSPAEKKARLEETPQP